MTMHLTRADLVAVGAASADHRRIIDDYERRISKYVSFRSHEVKGEPLRHPLTRGLQVEAERIRRAAAIGPDTRVVLLDSRGAQATSEQLVDVLLGAPKLVLIVGGAAGVTDELRASAHHVISFGRITMPHQLARLVATEQLYRALKISRNEPYHH